MGKIGKAIATVQAVKSIIETLVAVWNAVASYFQKEKQKEELEQANEAVEQNERANQIEDDEKRLKEKADAACKLEQVLNPDRKC